MSEFKRGERVLAIKDLGGGWSTSVSKGTKGVVVAVESHFFSSETFTVKWLIELDRAPR